MADFRPFFTRSTEADEGPGAKADFFNGLSSFLPSPVSGGSATRRVTPKKRTRNARSFAALGHGRVFPQKNRR